MQQAQMAQKVGAQVQVDHGPHLQKVVERPQLQTVCQLHFVLITFQIIPGQNISIATKCT